MVSVFSLSAVRCPRNNAAACYPALEKWLRASESSISCKSCFHLAELCPEMGARIVVASAELLLMFLKGERRLPAIFPLRKCRSSQLQHCLWAGWPSMYSLTSSALPPSRAPLCTEGTSTAPTREARSEQRAPAADTTTGMMLSKMQPQKEPRRGNLHARARALRQSV